MQIETKASRVTHWAKSTESKVTTFLDDYLINYPVKSVRHSTRNLLNSLYKKGTPEQKQNLLNLIKQRISKLPTIGSSSAEFLMLIFMIFQGEVQHKIDEQKQLLSMILHQGQQILTHVTHHQNYNLYSYLSNTIQFSTPLQPYLIEASGCLKCYGKTEFNFQQKDYKDVLRQIKAHISEIELVFKKTYAIKEMKINLGKKKIVYKSVSVYYVDDKGERRQLGGKYGPQQTLPTLQFSGKSLIFQFDYPRSRRHLSCHVCGNANMPDQYSYICSICFQKCVDIDGLFKVIGADPQQLSDELCARYLELECHKEELEMVYEDVRDGRRAQFPSYEITKEMEQAYGQVMRNLQLLKTDSLSPSLPPNLHPTQSKYCFSCNIIQIENIVDYFKKVFDITESARQQLLQSFSSHQISSLIGKFIEFSKLNKLNHLQKKIISILANLILIKNTGSGIINFDDQLKGIESANLVCQLLYSIMRLVKIKQNKLKQNQTSVFDWIGMRKYLNDNGFISGWTMMEKIKLFVTYFVGVEVIEGIGKDGEEWQWGEVERVEVKEFNAFTKLIDFAPHTILKTPATTFTKLFLLLLPQPLLPTYTYQLTDAQYLNHITLTIPPITPQLIYSNIIYSPQPILKLNLFNTLPNLISQLSLEDAMRVVTEMFKYKRLWNMNVQKAMKRFEEKLEGEVEERRLMLALEGYEVSKEEMYLNKIYEILVPQRTNIIIRLQVPQAQMQKQQRSRDGGPIQYVYLPVRQVKTSDLDGDTMRALHKWITKQMKQQYMAFDLIVDKYIIDKLDMPIQVVYKKIAQKEMKKKIGLQQYDFMKVIYRIQGIFGNANESSSPNPRDEKIQACLGYASYLLTKIPAINKTGIDVIMEIFGKLKRSQSSSYRQKVFKILDIISMKPEIIKKIIQCNYTDIIINFTSKFFSLQESELKFTEIMLNICSKIIKEANEEMINLRKKSQIQGYGMRKESEMMMQLENTDEESSESQKSVKYLLQKVKQCDQKDRKDLAEKIITIIPFLSKDEYGASKYLYQYFELSHTKVFDLKSNKKLNWFLQFIDTLAESYKSFKIVCRQNNLTDELVANIVQSIDYFKTLEEKKNIKNLDNLELSLSIIKGLMRGDEELQKVLFDKGVIQELEKISKLSDKQMQLKNIKVGKVLTLSYEIIKYLKQGRIVHPQVSDFIKGQHADKARRKQQLKRARQQAARKRNAQIAQQFQSMMVSQQQESILVCPICRQGYNMKQDVLGVYVYSSKMEISAIEGWWKESKRQQGLTSVSFFTPIHYQCHMDAWSIDQKNGKTQWDGALVRNSQVKLNAWLPIKAPRNTDQQYQKVNKKYFDKNTKLSTSFWIALNDLNGLLQKFSTEYNFSLQTKGSSATHNCKLILVLISTVCHYMRRAGQEQLKLLNQGVRYIEQHMTKHKHLLCLLFCVTLFVNSYSSYKQKIAKYLNMIEHLELADFKQKRKFYIYLALINQINLSIHAAIKEDNKGIYEQIDKFIPENFAGLIGAFEGIAVKYRNVFTKWEEEGQVREYFGVVG